MNYYMIMTALLLTPVVLAACKNTYMVTVPQSIRPGHEFSVCVVPLVRHLGFASMQFTLMNRKNKTITYADKDILLHSDPVVIKIKVPQNVSVGYGYQLDVKSMGGLSFAKRVTDMRMLSKTSSIFVQTDKAAYKPGDLVQFRVFGTNSRLRFLNDPINVILTDPKRNRVDQYLNVKPSYGVFTGSFQLSTLTNLGSWNIKVEQKQEKYTKSFTVEKYVLPKFQINVVFPPIVLRTDKYFTVDLDAQYTFGKPVEGNVNLTISRTWSNRNVINKRFKMRGKTTIRVLMSEILRLGSYIKVKAILSERLTGKKASDTKTIYIRSYPERLIFSDSISSNFKPGLDYTMIIRAAKVDGTPLDKPLGTVNITVNYSIRKKIPEEFETQVKRIYPGATESKVLWSRSVQIPESGIIMISARFPIAAVSGYINLKYRKAYGSKYLSRAYSPSNSFIQVSIANDAKAKPGRPLPLILETTDRRRCVHYKVFSKGTLVTQGKWHCWSKKQRVNLMITTKMAPSAKLLVYYNRGHNGEIVADVISFPIKDVFDNEVSIKFNKKKALPGEKVELQIKADAKSLVNILSVDKSVLLYKTGNDITVQDVMRELQQYDSRYYPFSWGWNFWFPRRLSGVDAFSIFEQAGVYVLTDALLYQYLSECSRGSGGGRRMFLFKGGSGSVSASSSSGKSGTLATPTRIRKNFPATWIWANTVTGYIKSSKHVFQPVCHIISDTLLIPTFSEKMRPSKTIRHLLYFCAKKT